MADYELQLTPSDQRSALKIARRSVKAEKEKKAKKR
jgi:hypothetical protein